MKKVILIFTLIGFSLGIEAQNTLIAKEDVYVNKGVYSTNSTGNGLGNLILFGDGSNGGGWQSSIKWSGIDGFNSNLSTGSRVNAEITVGNIGSYGRADLIFKTKGSYGNGTPTEKFRISANGNVGIGTTNPGSWKLAVNGKIRAKEVKVETGWSDFVFYDDYELPTLEEVEMHIEEKGHLKDIPSEKEVEENGILLGEMNSKLLQKIEELTLYTIQQQKEIEELKSLTKELLNSKK